MLRWICTSSRLGSLWPKDSGGPTYSGFCAQGDQETLHQEREKVSGHRAFGQAICCHVSGVAPEKSQDLAEELLSQPL